MKRLVAFVLAVAIALPLIPTFRVQAALLTLADLKSNYPSAISDEGGGNYVITGVIDSADPSDFIFMGPSETLTIHQSASVSLDIF